MHETNTVCPSDKRLDYVDKNLNQKRSVKVKTCADVYGHWRAYKRTYKKAPKDGVEFQIDYIDTGLALDEATRAQAPIALALHGAPGSYHDFALLIQHLTQQKVRVIAPNFPEYIATVKTKVLFRHSADEKAAYLRDFLLAIRVNKIDLLVSHSSAIFPTLLILLNANNEAIARQRNNQQVSPSPLVAAATCARQAPEAEEQLKQTRRQRHGRTRNACDNNKVDKKEEEIVGGANNGKISNTLEPHDASRQQLNLFNSCEETKRNGLDLGDGEGDEEETFEDASEVLDSNNNEKSLERGARLTPDQKQIKSEEKNVSDDDGDDDENENNDEEAEEEEKARQIDEQFNLTTNKFEAPNKQSESLVNHNDRVQPRRINKKKKKPTDVIVQFDQAIEIKAVALLNPAGHRLPKSMKPTWFKCGSVHVYQHKFGRSLFRKFGPAFLTVVGVPVRVDNMDNVMLSATVMRNSKCQRVSKQLQQLSEMKIPTLLVFSENDKLIEKEIFYEMTHFMKLDNRNFDIFNNDGDIELSQSSMEDWIRVMVFKAGGHYAYSNYAKTVNQAVSELLEKVRNKTSNNK